MDDRWKQVEKIYHAARELDRPARAALLTETCAGDETLRAEVESLLDYEDQAGSFLESPAIQVEAKALAKDGSVTCQHDTSNLAGTMVSHYRILEKLGGGGMGVVYEAEDTALGRHVALKFLPEEFSRVPEKLERFRREAWSASALNHPNICTIHEIGEHAGQPFIAMELIEGQTLANKLKAGPLAIEQVTDISCQVADALEEAHDHNIVHRDLKPLNLMVTPKGRVKVLDFGLAKLVRPVEPDAPTQEDLSQTRAGTLMGTIPYMAPEQLRGRPVDARADLYALGVVLYEMATGERPFPETQTTPLMAAILTQTPRPPRELNPQVTPQLERVILRAIEKDPDRRYPSAQQLRADLCSLAGAAPRAHAPGEAVWPWNWGLPTAKLALIAAIVITLLASLFWFVVPAARRLITKSQQPVQGLPIQKHLAVLPFTVIGGTPRDEAFSRGLQETLAAKLTQLSSDRSLQVVPVGDLAAQHIKTATDARKVFGVNLALTGRLERAGNRFRVSYALVNTSSMFQLRVRNLTPETSDPLAIQDSVFEGTVKMLGLDVSPARRQAIRKNGTQVPGAFHDYIEGLGYLQDYDRAENIDKAINAFQSALNVDGAYTLSYAGLGRAYWLKYATTRDTRWVDLAQRSCSRAVTLDPKLPATHLCLGISESGTGRYAEAVEQFQTVLKTEPTNYSAFEGLAGAQFKLNLISKAEATYRRAISIRPNYWAPYDNLGTLYYKIGEYQKAVAMFRKVIQLAPENRLGYYNLGAANVQLGNWAEAEKLFKKSIAIHPTAEAYSNLGTLTYAQGRFGQSAGYFEKAVQLKPKDATLWGNLGDAYKWSSHQRARAVEAYRKAAALAQEGLLVNPRSSELLGQLAIYEAQGSNFNQALRYLRKGLSLAPQNVQLIYNAALVYHLCGRQTMALNYLRRARIAGYPVRTLQSDPEWSTLAHNPAFQGIIGIGQNQERGKNLNLGGKNGKSQD